LDFRLWTLLGSHPIAFRFRIAKGGGILRIEVAKIIPATAGPLGHRVGFALRPIRKVDSIFRAGEWRLAVGGGFVVVQRRGENWQHRFGQGFMAGLAIWASFPDDGERFAPVTLPT